SSPNTDNTQAVDSIVEETGEILADPQHHKSLPIDLSIPGHLPDSIDLTIGRIRYELQVSLEVTMEPGTSNAVTENVILRRPVLIHRIVYPSTHLQPRVAMGLDGGGVEIQVKVPRLLHCENTLLAVEIYTKPRTRTVKLRKARVVFEQIETDRSAAVAAVPKAVVPVATVMGTSSTTSPLPALHSPPIRPALTHGAGPPPVPRLLTRNIAQPLEVEFEEPTTEELETQTLHLQLVLSPEMCVDVQCGWLQISHMLRVEIEYSMEDEAYMTPPPQTPTPASVGLSQTPALLTPAPPTSPPPLLADISQNQSTGLVVEGDFSENGEIPRPSSEPVELVEQHRLCLL
ncbi:hypothetical protein BGW38_007949, partial [Lunasporangiospora selenospora]